MIASPLILTGCAATGLVVGSFVVTAALRSVRGEQALAGRSRCDGCGVGLGFAATTPLISYAMARGACAGCGARIDPLHPIGEAAGAVIVLAAVLAAQTPIRAGLLAALGLVLLATSVIDARSRRLPDVLTAIVALIGFGLAAQRGEAAIGLAAGGVAFLLADGVRRGFLLVRKRPGLGFGDVKLIAALAVWLGLATPWAVVAAAVLGLATFAIVRPADGRLAFGPALAAAGFAVGLMVEAGVLPALGAF